MQVEEVWKGGEELVGKKDGGMGGSEGERAIADLYCVFFIGEQRHGKTKMATLLMVLFGTPMKAQQSYAAETIFIYCI